MPRDGRFVELPLDKRAWSPSPLLGQVVLVTTVDAGGRVDVAPKSWVSMVSFAGPVLGFGCNLGHATYRNVAETGEFVVNVPDASLAADTWRMLAMTDRLAGLTLVPARTVAPPVIAQCAGYLECRHERTVELADGEVFVLGTVTAVAVDEAGAGAADPADRYAALNPFFFLEDGWYAPAAPAHRVRPEPAHVQGRPAADRDGADLGSADDGPLVRPRRPSDAAALGALLRRDHPRTGYPTVMPADPEGWVSSAADLAAFVATDLDGVVIGHVSVQAAAGVDHGTGPALQAAWSRALGRPPEECAVVSRLFVSVEHQGRGVGARLLERAVGWVQGRGLAPCLDVLPLPNDDALRFYERLGWARAGELRAHWHRPGWPPLVALVLPDAHP